MNTHLGQADRSVSAELPTVTAGMMKAMPYGSGEVTRDLSDALSLVLGRTPETPEPVVVLAWYLDSLAKEYGLSESLDLDISPLDRVAIPAAGAAVIDHYLGGAEGHLDLDALRNRLYAVFVEISGDREARGLLNKNQPLSDIGLLHLAQIYWNLEGTSSRAKLPIRPGQQIAAPAGTVAADIKVPGAQKDFATMKWAARVVEKGSYKSSGQSFRRQGARLAVLAAQRIAASVAQPEGLVERAVDEIERAVDETGALRILSIKWREAEPLLTELPAYPPSRAFVGAGGPTCRPGRELSAARLRRRHRPLVGGRRRQAHLASRGARPRQVVHRRTCDSGGRHQPGQRSRGTGGLG